MSETCIVFDVTGDFAHFRRPHTTSPAQTFGIPPRTTVAGMVAGILGLPRDSYYDTFSRDTSRIAVSLEAPIRRLQLAINILTTEGSDSKTKGARPGPDITGHRQQNVFETLADPHYRFYISLDDDELMDELEDTLTAGRSTYALSLGLSEHLASYEYRGRHSISRESGEATIKTAVPGDELSLIPEADAEYVSERMPAFMKSHDRGGRVSDGFHRLTYDRSGDGIAFRDIDHSVVDGENVVFT